ncbi:uncharacterized protein LOC110600514 [Manihot esculenta]|uniref:uncharacterized protein LOC110600514 n=1 Tax=Manihot esculenta TaxID=3983 RepID=UPI000B5D1715|nr:uncharacterized protein LOC110600514 [Manihot esculenta]
MRIICWNCRGVGNPRAVNAMADLVFYYKPSILFLMETKVHGVRMNQIKNLLHYSNCFSVDSIGIGGGLSVDSIGFYGCPEPTRRRTSWNLLRELSSRNDLPWLCCGDYNDIAAPEEKSGGEGTPFCSKERLDRVCSNTAWSGIFPDALSSLLVAPVSDHNPLLVETTAPTCHIGSRRIRFDNSWLEDPELGEWGRNRNKLKRAQKDMIRKRLEEDLDSADAREVRRLKEQWNQILAEEEIRIRQQAKLFWFRNGDKNTKYFHNNIKARRRQNRIVEITTSDGSISSDQHVIADTFQSYFQKLFSGAVADFGEVISLVQPKVDSHDNAMLTATFVDEEFRHALFQMNPDKAPGLDGLNPAFFQRHWKILGPDILAFVPSRLITDNFIIAFETIHGLKQQTRGSDGFCALKIDIAKTYDRVDWAYLSAMLSALGFSTTWIGWMRMCFSDIIYKIALNGSEIGPVIPTRGLRQGDPISPYLFFIVAEGLSLLIQNRESQGLIQGCPAKQGCPRISHLFFADNSLLFFKGTVMEASQVISLLAVYEKASGQSINFDKSAIMFSPCIRDDICIAVSTILNIHQPLGTSTYLGLPSLVGRSKKQIFSFLKDRIWKRINSWNNRFLSRAGCEVLIKAVLQAIPAYCMNVFLLPLATCSQLQVMLNKFWWRGGMDDRRGINWLAWDRMCVQKGDGGMGFRDLRCFNAALLGKQGWRILSDTNSLLYNVLRAKYFPSGDFMSASLGSNYSYVWKSVHSSQQLLVRGTRWRVGDGRSIFVKNNPWLSSDSNFVPNDPMFIDDAMHVSDLFVPGELRWDLEKVLNIFFMDDVRSILAIPLPLNPRPDKLIWHFEKRGFYMVKTAYYCALSMLGQHLRVGTSDLWKKVWALDVPPKVQDFIWRLFRGVLPTRDNLTRRGVDVPLGCLFCDANESIDHLFFSCPMVGEVWRLVGVALSNSWLSFQDLFLHIHAIHSAANTFYTDYLDCGLDKQRAPGPSLLSNNAGSASSASDWLAYVDCATFSTSDLFGFGVVFEDAEGVFSIAISGYTEGRGSPAIAEALALRQCLMYARDAFLQAGSIFIDSQIRRSANKAAHLLARQSIRFDRFKLWVNMPECLFEHYSSR